MRIKRALTLLVVFLLLPTRALFGDEITVVLTSKLDSALASSSDMWSWEAV